MNLWLSDTEDAVVNQATKLSIPNKNNRVAPKFTFPADTLQQVYPIPFIPACLYVRNFSNVTFILTFDDGSTMIANVGCSIIDIPPNTGFLKGSSTSVGTGTLIVVPFAENPDLPLGGYNVAAAPNVGTEHISNGTAGAVAQLAPARPNGRISLTIENEDSTNTMRVGNHADSISTTVGFLLPPNASVTFIGSEQVDVVAVTGSPKWSAVEAYY